jgi:hypothetical protein
MGYPIAVQEDHTHLPNVLQVQVRIRYKIIDDSILSYTIIIMCVVVQWLPARAELCYKCTQAKRNYEISVE